MSNYAESKKTLDKIRSEYGCKGDVLFRTAIQCVVEYGTNSLLDDWNYEHLRSDINERHDAAESECRLLFISRDFELAILECAREIAMVNIYDLLVYIQKEVWLSGDGLDYQRAIELLKNCIYDIEERENCEDKLLLQALDNIGFYDSEIEELGFGYLLNTEEEN